MVPNREGNTEASSMIQTRSSITNSNPTNLSDNVHVLVIAFMIRWGAQLLEALVQCSNSVLRKHRSWLPGLCVGGASFACRL